MKRDWKDVKDEIEKEIDAIWVNEPIEVTLTRKGIFPGRAGAYHDTYFGNLFFRETNFYCIFCDFNTFLF